MELLERFQMVIGVVQVSDAERGIGVATVLLVRTFASVRIQQKPVYKNLI